MESIEQHRKENKLQKLLGKQFLITAYIESRLQLVNYIKEGYDDNLSILINSRFLHFTAHTFYRSVIVDLFSLFGKPGKENRYSLLQINSDCSQFLNKQCIDDVAKLLSNCQDDIATITKLRHNQIAHFNFEQNEGISLDFDNLDILNTLFKTAVKIITMCGESFLAEEDRTGYDFERESQYIRSLEKLIGKANGHK